MKIRYSGDKKIMNKELLGAYIFGGLAILLGIVIILFGEIGRGIGDTIYKFRGLERLYGLYPIAIGSIAIWAFRIKYSKEKDDE